MIDQGRVPEIVRYDDLAARVLREPPALGAVRVLAVDGPAGSGKTTFADRIATALRARGAVATVFHTDDLLDGWTDLVTYWPRLEEWVLQPLARGEPARFRCYDWDRGSFGDEWHPLAVPDVLVLEGVSSARAAAATYLSLAVFVVAPSEVRLRRGLDRDGEALRGEWLRWMDREERHFAVDGTRDRADVCVDGSPSVVHDPRTAFVTG